MKALRLNWGEWILVLWSIGISLLYIVDVVWTLRLLFPGWIIAGVCLYLAGAAEEKRKEGEEGAR